MVQPEAIWSPVGINGMPEVVYHKPNPQYETLGMQAHVSSTVDKQHVGQICCEKL